MFFLLLVAGIIFVFWAASSYRQQCRDNAAREVMKTIEPKVYKSIIKEGEMATDEIVKINGLLLKNKIICPRCFNLLILRFKNSYYYRCSQYPKCDYIENNQRYL